MKIKNWHGLFLYLLQLIKNLNMRFFKTSVLCCLFLGLSFCKTATMLSQEKTLLKVDSLPNGSKKLHFFKNKKLEVVNNNGSLSYTMVPSHSTNVIQYVYAINQEQVAYDGGYREEILFEIPAGTLEQTYTNKNLQNTKMLFGRYCFCRGKTGLYKVMEGKLHLKASKKKTRFKLQFKINEVPQVTTEISY